MNDPGIQNGLRDYIKEKQWSNLFSGNKKRLRIIRITVNL